MAVFVLFCLLLMRANAQCTSNYCPNKEKSGGDLRGELADLRLMFQNYMWTTQQEVDILKQQLQKAQESIDLLKVWNGGPNCQYLLDVGFKYSGEYTLYFPGLPESKKVYCDQVTSNGGWLVIQRRVDGSVDFYRNWANYTEGFGDVNTEFWLGNKIIHQLTTSTPMELRIDMTLANGTKAYATYSHFSIASETDSFTLSVSGYAGNAGDKLSYHNSMKWSTPIRENDDYSSQYCAERAAGAWWYKGCFESNLNGPYASKLDASHTSKAIHWSESAASAFRFLTFTEMKLRPKKG